MRRLQGLDAADKEALKLAVCEISEVVGRRVSIGSLLASWDDFVQSVERGYDDCVYEYTNDLNVRDLLSGLVSKLPRSTSEKLSAIIRPVDDRFVSATLKTERPLLSTDSSGWWWFRIPLRRSSQLQKDLEDEGVIPDAGK